MRLHLAFTPAVRDLALALAAGAMLCGCAAEDIVKELSSHAIAFSAAINDAPSARSAGADTTAAANVTVNCIEGADSLFLHTSVSEREPVGEAVVSRAAPVSDLSGYGSFGVYAYIYEGAWDDVKSQQPVPYMNNVEVTDAGNGYWESSTAYYWPAHGRNIRFFASAPRSALTCTGITAASYHVPGEVGAQKDVLAATSAECEGVGTHEPVNLKFRHILTAVRFTAGSNMQPGRITKITLSGVFANGIYDFESGNWETTGASNFSFSQTLDSKLDGTPDAEITPAEATFMMIPQTLPSGAKIIVEYTDDLSGVKNTIDADISGTEWAPGKIVEYRLSTTSIDVVPAFNVEIANNHFTYKGGTSTVKVTSYANFRKNGVSFHTKPMAWTAKFYGYNSSTGEYDLPLSARPSWIAEFAETSAASDNVTTFNCKVSEQSPRTINESTINLANAAQKGSSSSPYNLSTKGGSISASTANCYIVDAAGYYSLPLIYGNAIKNGQFNTQAYIKDNDPKFIRHDGNTITSPYILANLGGTFTAELGWTDISGQVVSVTRNTQNYNLTIGGSSVSVPHVRFQINKGNLTSGNIFILLKNSSGTVVWSWHIWVTDRADESLTVGGKKMLPLLLGWSHDAKRIYDERNVKVVFIQSGTNATKEMLIAQEQFEAYVNGTCTFYQWGRKDPMIGRNGNANVTWYDINNAVHTNLLTISSAATNPWTRVYQMISSPWAFYNVPDTYPVVHHFWNINNTAGYQNHSSGIKTVYDPCPPGFRVPTAYEIDNYLTRNSNRAFDEVSNAWRFDTNNANKKAFFPFIGARDYVGNLVLLNQQCRVWTSQTFQNGMRLYFITKAEFALMGYTGASNDGAAGSNGASIIAFGE